MCENSRVIRWIEMFMKRLFLAAVLGGFSLTACGQSSSTAPKAAAKPVNAAAPAANAQDAAANNAARAAIAKVNPKLGVDYVGAAPVPGFREAIVSGELLYISDDGHYLVQGNVIDLQSGRDLAQGSPALAKYRAGLLAQVPKAQRIVFAPPNPKYTVSVFTDVECGYCRKLHSQIADYNRQGIAVEYLAWPRAGLGTQNEAEMVAVWCAPNREQALTDAKSDKPIAALNCNNPVAAEFKLGQKLGVNGTPAVFAADGTQIGGYLAPAQMRAALDQLAAKNN